MMSMEICDMHLSVKATGEPEVHFDHRFDTHNASAYIPNKLIYQAGKCLDLYLPWIASFLKQLPASRIGLYGVGELTKRLLIEKPESLSNHKIVLIETKARDTKFHGFQIITVDCACNDDFDRVIIMSLQYEEQMTATLSKRFTKQVYRIVDILNHVELPARRSLLQNIIKRIVADKYLRSISRVCKKNPKVIAFATPSLHMKYLKLLRTLKENEFGVVVIAEKEYVSRDFGYHLDSFSQDYFDLCFTFQCYFDLFAIELLKSGDFYLAHLITSTAGTRKLANIVVNADCAVVTEYDDFLEICFSNDRQYLKHVPMVDSDIILERQSLNAIFCQSNGIIQRHSPQIIEILSKKHNFRPRWLSFAPYPSQRNFMQLENSRRNRSFGDTVKIVSVVGILNDPSAHNYARTQSLFTIGRMLDAQGIKFAIYNLLDMTGNGFEDVLAFAGKSSHFDYYFAVPHDHLIAELSDYHWGWHCMEFDQTDDSLRYSELGVSSKHYTYVEAGLPIIISKEIAYDSQRVEKEGIGVSIRYEDVKNIRPIIENCDYSKICENVLIYREKWSMERQLYRLCSFYEEVRHVYSSKNVN